MPSQATGTAKTAERAEPASAHSTISDPHMHGQHAPTSRGHQHDRAAASDATHALHGLPAVLDDRRQVHVQHLLPAGAAAAVEYVATLANASVQDAHVQPGQSTRRCRRAQIFLCARVCDNTRTPPPAKLHRCGRAPFASASCVITPAHPSLPNCTGAGVHPSQSDSRSAQTAWYQDGSPSWNIQHRA